MSFPDSSLTRDAIVTPDAVHLSAKHVLAMHCLLLSYAHYKKPMTQTEIKVYLREKHPHLWRDNLGHSVAQLALFDLAVRVPVKSKDGKKEVKKWVPTRRGVEFMEGRFAPPATVGVWRSESLGEKIDDDDPVWKSYRGKRSRSPVFVHQVPDLPQKMHAQFAKDKREAIEGLPDPKPTVAEAAKNPHGAASQMPEARGPTQGVLPGIMSDT